MKNAVILKYECFMACYLIPELMVFLPTQRPFKKARLYCDKMHFNG